MIFGECTKVIMKEVELVEIPNLANKNNLDYFIHAYMSFLIHFKQNTYIKLRLINTFKILLTNLLSLVKPRALVDLLT